MPHQHFVTSRPSIYCQFLCIANPGAVYKLQDALTFFRSNLIFPAPGSTPDTKKCGNILKKAKNQTWSIRPPTRLPEIAPHEGTQDKIKLAHAPPLSPIHANDTPIANLFGKLRGLSQNKRISAPRETTALISIEKEAWHTHLLCTIPQGAKCDSGAACQTAIIVTSHFKQRF
jgi:hypothetical protein